MLVSCVYVYGWMVLMAIFGRQLITFNLYTQIQCIVYVFQIITSTGKLKPILQKQRILITAKNCVSKSFTTIGLVFGHWTIPFVGESQ